MAVAKSPYFDLLLGTIEDFNRCETPNALTERLVSFSSHLGYNFAAYIASPTVAPTFKSRLVLGNWPKDWVNQYTQPGWNQRDRVAHALRMNKRVFSWSSVKIPTDDKKAQRVMETAARDFKMCAGVCVPIHDQNSYRAGFSFSGLEADQSDEALGVLQMVSLFAESQIRLSRPTLDCQKKLTPREREVLTWAAAGKTAWDTGAILNIAEGTVNRIAFNAMTKLNVHNKAQAIAEAIRIGEIKP
ncbi:MAG: LuxR family transcriptional regulator [Rhizobiales bacterium]|nr:LuxR family transcriptional regulator [Hyphomicrobiales bacterium]